MIKLAQGFQNRAEKPVILGDEQWEFLALVTAHMEDVLTSIKSGRAADQRALLLLGQGALGRARSLE